MPKTMKQRIYTYDQLDALLLRRGGPPNQHGNITARLYSHMHVVAHRQPYLRLVKMRPDGSHGYTLAYIWRVAGGDTTYAVAPLDDDLRRSPQARVMYRKDCKRFTPRAIVGRIPKDWAWYRIHNGEARPIAEASVREGPANCSLLLPRCTRPSYAEWTGPHLAHHPKLCGRAKAFFTRLRRELKDGPACTVQLIRREERGNALFHPNGMHLHVVMPPTERGQSPRLLVSVWNHDQHSRQRFDIDGDFAVRHAYVIGKSAGEDELHWRSTKHAIVGITEWVLANIYIPGL